LRTFIDIGARKKGIRNYNVNDNFRSALNGNPSTQNNAKNKINQPGEDDDAAPKKKSKGWQGQVGGAFDH